MGQMMTAQNQLALSHQVVITKKIMSCISNLENHHVNKWVFVDKVGIARLVCGDACLEPQHSGGGGRKAKTWRLY